MTYNEIVNSAMRLLGLTQAGETPTAGEYEVGIERLNNMVSGWRNAGLQMDWSNVDLTDGGLTAQFDDEDLDAVITNLAMTLADDYGKQPRATIAMRARQGYSGLYAKWDSGPAMIQDRSLQPAFWPGFRWGRWIR